jgi:hypothetical protein
MIFVLAARSLGATADTMMMVWIGGVRGVDEEDVTEMRQMWCWWPIGFSVFFF